MGCTPCGFAVVLDSPVISDVDGVFMNAAKITMLWHMASIHPDMFPGDAERVADEALASLHAAGLDPRMNLTEVSPSPDGWIPND